MESIGGLVLSTFDKFSRHIFDACVRVGSLVELQNSNREAERQMNDPGPVIPWGSLSTTKRFSLGSTLGRFSLFRSISAVLGKSTLLF